MSQLTMKTLAGFAGLGQTGQCGQAPQIAAGESKQCCPGVGWVIFDSSESAYGICERAKAMPGTSAASSTATSSSSDPMVQVEEMQRKLEERRSRAEEDRHERMKQEIKLRFVMGQMQSVQAQEAARVEAKRRAEAARRKAEAERKRRARNQKLIIGGVVAFGVGRLLKII